MCLIQNVSFSRSSVASQRKPERKNAPARSQRPKQTTSQVARDVTAAVSASSTTDQEMETLPEIETMSRRAEEPDECKETYLFPFWE